MKEKRSTNCWRNRRLERKRGIKTLIGRSDKSGKSENIVVLSRGEEHCSREEEGASTGVCGKRRLQSLVGRRAYSCRSKRRGEATNEEQRMPRGTDAETKRDCERKRDENALLGVRVSSLFGILVNMAGREGEEMDAERKESRGPWRRKLSGVESKYVVPKNIYSGLDTG